MATEGFILLHCLLVTVIQPLKRVLAETAMGGFCLHQRVCQTHPNIATSPCTGHNRSYIAEGMWEAVDTLRRHESIRLVGVKVCASRASCSFRFPCFPFCFLRSHFTPLSEGDTKRSIARDPLDHASVCCTCHSRAEPMCCKPHRMPLLMARHVAFRSRAHLERHAKAAKVCGMLCCVINRPPLPLPLDQPCRPHAHTVCLRACPLDVDLDP